MAAQYAQAERRLHSGMAAPATATSQRLATARVSTRFCTVTAKIRMWGGARARARWEDGVGRGVAGEGKVEVEVGVDELSLLLVMLPVLLVLLRVELASRRC